MSPIKRTDIAGIAAGVLAALWLSGTAAVQTPGEPYPPSSPESQQPEQSQPEERVQPGRTVDRMAANTALEVSPGDRRFLETAIGSGIAEVQEAELAERQGASPDVRRAAEHLVRDHKAANDELQRIAGVNGIVAPKEAPDERKGVYSRLRGLSGAAFDKEFLRSQIDAHQRSIALFQQATTESRNVEVKAFARSKLPTLKQHLDLLRGIEDKSSAANSPGSGQ